MEKILERKRWQSVLFTLIYLFSGWKVKSTRIEQVSLPSVGVLVWFFYLNSIMGSVIFPLI